MWSKGEWPAALSEDAAANTVEGRRARALAGLEVMLAGLGPDVWLELGEAAVGRYFGNGPEGMEAAKTFGKNAGCVVLTPDGKSVKFGRAYYNRTN